jgi:pyruvate-formate lyase-activating enzyme
MIAPSSKTEPAASAWKVVRQSPLRSLIFEIYDRCPLSCRHCSQGFSSSHRGPGNKTDPELLCQMIEEADPRIYQNITFIGGEASLVPEVVAAGVDAAHRRGFTASLTTAPIWATTAKRAAAFLDSLPHLDYMNLSYDSYHLEFLKPHHYLNAIDAASERKTLAFLTVTYSRAGELEEILPKVVVGLPKVTSVVVNQVMPVGNANDPARMSLEGTLMRSEADLESIVRSCAIGETIVNVGGAVHACCWSTTVEETPLKYRDSHSSSFGQALCSMEKDPTFIKLRQSGLVDGLSDSGKSEVFEQVRNKTIVNECHLCSILMRQENRRIWNDYVGGTK